MAGIVILSSKILKSRPGCHQSQDLGLVKMAEILGFGIATTDHACWVSTWHQLTGNCGVIWYQVHTRLLLEVLQ